MLKNGFTNSDSQLSPIRVYKGQTLKERQLHRQVCHITVLCKSDVHEFCFCIPQIMAKKITRIENNQHRFSYCFF